MLQHKIKSSKEKNKELNRKFRNKIQLLELKTRWIDSRLDAIYWRRISKWAHQAKATCQTTAQRNNEMERRVSEDRKGRKHEKFQLSLKRFLQEFPGSSVIRTQCSLSRRFNPRSGNSRLHSLRGMAKKKKKKKPLENIYLKKGTIINSGKMNVRRGNFCQ